METIGRGSSRECPKGGYLWLKRKSGGLVTVRVRCKTWGCLGCRDQVRGRVQARIENGLSIIGRCVLITLTLKPENEVWDALSVQKVWRAFLQKWKKRYPERRKIVWFRMIEATKIGTPHLHVLVGDYGSGSKMTLHAEIKPIWKEVTGGSWWVGVRQVVGPKGMASYLGKYLAKQAISWSELEKRGFTRRFSCSAGWPRLEGFCIAEVKDGVYEAAGYTWKGSAGAALAESKVVEVGAAGQLGLYASEATEAFYERVRRRGAVRELRKRGVI